MASASKALIKDPRMLKMDICLQDFDMATWVNPDAWHSLPS